MNRKRLDVTASANETARRLENMYEFDIAHIRKVLSQLSAVPVGNRSANEYVIALMISHMVKPGLLRRESFAQFWLDETPRVENTVAAIGVFFTVDVAYTTELVRRLLTCRVDAAMDPLKFYYNYAYYMFREDMDYDGSESPTEERRVELSNLVAYTLDSAIRKRQADISAFAITGNPSVQQRSQVKNAIVDICVEALAEAIEKTRPDASRFVNKISRKFAASYVETISNYIGGYYTCGNNGEENDYSLRIALSTIVDVSDSADALYRFFSTGIVDFSRKTPKEEGETV